MTRPIRLAFAGASAVGKSTLAAHVAKRYSLPTCPVGSRSVAAEMGFASPYDVDAAGRRDEFQRRLFEGKLSWEHERFARGEGFVTDRTPLDNLAYRALAGAGLGLSREEWLRHHEAMGLYTEVVYVPLAQGQWLDGDPARLQAEGYHRLFDVMLRGLLQASGAFYETLRVATLERRKAWLDQWLGEP